MVLYYLLLAPCLYLCVLISFSAPPLPITMELYYVLLAHCHSLWYSTILCLPFYTFETLLPSTGSMRIPLLPSTGSLPIPMVLYYLLLTPCLSLWNSTTFYWPNAYTNGILLSSNGPCISPWYSIVFYWPNAYTNGILLSSNGPCISPWYSFVFYWPNAYTMILYYLLLAPFLSLWYSSIF